MHTIALVSRKGGTGKSTLAIGMAIAAVADGHKVCLLEADPLGTLSNWRRRRVEPEPTVETVHDGYELARRVPFLAHCGVTLTIIDTAGGWSDTATAAIGAADLCLIPVRPSPADIEAAVPTLAAIRERGKPFAFVLNQTPARSTRLESAAASLGETAASLHVTGVLALPTIVLRNDQQDALGKGLAVTEYAHEGKSADEIRGLWQWVWGRLISLAPQDAQLPAQTATSPANEETELRAVG
jgi:chromosome partitioning protein